VPRLPVKPALMADTVKDIKPGEGWRTAKYVRHADISIYLARGWKLVDDLQATHHGQHAVLMELPDDVETKDTD
jgi:hypothetical protein